MMFLLDPPHHKVGFFLDASLLPDYYYILLLSVSVLGLTCFNHILIVASIAIGLVVNEIMTRNL